MDVSCDVISDQQMWPPTCWSRQIPLCVISQFPVTFLDWWSLEIAEANPAKFRLNYGELETRKQFVRDTRSVVKVGPLTLLCVCGLTSYVNGCHKVNLLCCSVYSNLCGQCSIAAALYVFIHFSLCLLRKWKIIWMETLRNQRWKTLREKWVLLMGSGFVSTVVVTTSIPTSIQSPQYGTVCAYNYPKCQLCCYWTKQTA